MVLTKEELKKIKETGKLERLTNVCESAVIISFYEDVVEANTGVYYPVDELDPEYYAGKYCTLETSLEHVKGGLAFILSFSE